MPVLNPYDKPDISCFLGEELAAKEHSAAEPQPKELRTAESASWQPRNETRGLSGSRLLKIFDHLRDSDRAQCKERKASLFPLCDLCVLSRRSTAVAASAALGSSLFIRG
jgi:hypothetical protein